MLVGRRGRLGAEVGRRVLHEDGVAHVAHFRRTQVGAAVHVLAHTVGAKHFTAMPAVTLQTKHSQLNGKYEHNLLYLIKLVILHSIFN